MHEGATAFGDMVAQAAVSSDLLPILDRYAEAMSARNATRASSA
jgi:hypothetical protein